MANRERFYIFIIGMLVANAAITGALLTGYLAKPSWIIPPDSMVVAKDFISVIQGKGVGK